MVDKLNKIGLDTKGARPSNGILPSSELLVQFFGISQ